MHMQVSVRGLSGKRNNSKLGRGSEGGDMGEIRREGMGLDLIKSLFSCMKLTNNKKLSILYFIWELNKGNRVR